MTFSNFAIAASAVCALVLRLGQAPPASAYPFILSLQLMLIGLALIGYFLAAMVQRQSRSTQALKDAQSALVSSARGAGRAKIATSVLHNVGNVLNSVNVSAQVVVGRLQASRLPGSRMFPAWRGCWMRRADLGAYLARDEKGRLLPTYLGQLAACRPSNRCGCTSSSRMRCAWTSMRWRAQA